MLVMVRRSGIWPSMLGMELGLGIGDDIFLFLYILYIMNYLQLCQKLVTDIYPSIIILKGIIEY